MANKTMFRFKIVISQKRCENKSMITAMRPYNTQKRQNQNFRMKIQENLLQGCREGNVEFINRIISGVPGIYTVEENQTVIRQIIEDPATKMTKALQNLGKYLGVKKD